MRGGWTLVAAAGALALALGGVEALAKGRSADRIARETLALRLSGQSVEVTNVMVFAQPLPGAIVVPAFAGALGLRGRGYARSVPDGVLVRPGATRVSLRYAIPLPSQGVSASWAEPLPVGALWIRTGAGVDLPIELNQAFYAEGASAGGGIDAPLSLARDLPAGPLRLNFEFRPPPPPAFWHGLYELLGFVAIGVGWVWWARRPNRAALAKSQGGGKDG